MVYSCSVNKRASGQLAAFQRAQEARTKALSSLRAIVHAAGAIAKPAASSQVLEARAASVVASAPQRGRFPSGKSQGQGLTQGMEQLALGLADLMATGGGTAPKRPLPASNGRSGTTLSTLEVVDLTDSPPPKRQNG